MRRGINSPADLWINAKTIECPKILGNFESSRVREFDVAIVRQSDSRTVQEFDLLILLPLRIPADWAIVSIGNSF